MHFPQMSGKLPDWLINCLWFKKGNVCNLLSSAPYVSSVTLTNVSSVTGREHNGNLLHLVYTLDFDSQEF